MANPVSNHLVSGTVKDRLGNLLIEATVTLTHESISPVLSTTTGSDGKYVLNLGGLDSAWAIGQDITLFSTTQFKGRKSTTVVIFTGTSQTVNLTMEETSDFSIAETDETKRHNLVFSTLTTYDQEKVTHSNPLPVDLQNKSGESIDPATNESVEGIHEQFQSTAFDELSTAEASPVVQVQFPYNINTDIWEIRDNNGTASISNNKANLSTGTGANQSSTILTKTPVKYNPGQGALIRFTAVYTIGVADSTQYAGIGNSTDGFFFGYNGDTFGILRRQGGKPETRRLVITTASNTNEDITITLAGDAVSDVTVTATGGDTDANKVTTANEIAAHDWSNVGEGWEVHNMGPNVFFTSFTDGSKTGTYSLSSGGESAGTFSQSLAGVTSTETIVNQSDWNIDSCDGGGPSGLSCNFTKGNVFQIRYQWLGFGSIDFFIENPITGDYILVHRIEYANTFTVPSVDNPTLPLFAQAKNTSNTSDVVLEIGSMGGFVEGRDTLPGLPHSLSVEKIGIGTTETPVMTLHSHDIYQSTLNRVKIKMTLGSISTDGTKNTIIRIRKNTVLTGPVAFTALDSDISTIHRDTAATGITGGTVVFAEGADKVGTVIIDLEKLGVTMVAPDFLTVTVQATAAASVDVVATLNWQELF